MASIQEAFVAYTEAQLPTVGKGYPNLVPADATPAWSYRLMDDEEQMAHSGGTGFYFARIEVQVFADKSLTDGAYKKAQAQADAIRALWHGYKGAIGAVNVHYCRVSKSDNYGELRELPAERLEVFINYRLD